MILSIQKLQVMVQQEHMLRQEIYRNFMRTFGMIYQILHGLHTLTINGGKLGMMIVYLYLLSTSSQKKKIYKELEYGL